MSFITNPAYNSSSNSIRNWIINKLTGHYVSETLAAVTNGADSTFYYYVDITTYRKAGFQFELDCDAGTVTVTIEGTLQDDGTAPASCTYQDITSDTFGVTSLVASAGSASDMWIDNSEKLACFKYVRIKVVAATGGTTGDWTIYHRRLY